MLEEHNCEARVYDRFGGSNCSRRGVVFEDDKWWCRQHSPSATKARREAAKRRSDEDIRQHEQGWKQAHERERRANCFNELVAALEWIDTYLANQPLDQQAKFLITQKVREALAKGER